MDARTVIEESGAIERGTFKLADGVLTDYYVDKYAFETNPELLSALTDELAAVLEDRDVDVLLGPALGAVPLVTALSLRLGLPAAYIRHRDRHPGTRARIEGEIGEGDRVALVEDVTATGKTMLDAIEVVETVGGRVEHTLVVVDRNEEAVEALAEAGHDLEFLVRIGDDIAVDS